jgi:prepilin-type N-terminal cleavage/methylation domain-containing protein
MIVRSTTRKHRSTRQRRAAFSLLEVIAAVVILAVVAAATVSAIAPLREKARQKVDDQNVARLNAIVQAYYMETGEWPDENLAALQTEGYADQKSHDTPYGGNYTFDSSTKRVVNANRPSKGDG